ncbi:hypothetical protein FB45DRAFT_916111 [Roridomyces roridus]|uniref:Uncharacterized protein n=1 Tax=Roridomyces roridus TaxID=1738132 RepID=A0AAD7FP40_9AGAR|nr:hypothetical protein FB45DRAFT_916111 [Roridomyces roridus]
MANAEPLASSLPGRAVESPQAARATEISPEDVPVPPSPVLEPVGLPQVQQPVPLRPTLVPLGGHAAHTHAPVAPKKFSAVNINKKFLEKNSSTSTTSAPTSVNSNASKTGAAMSRPQAQTTTSHPRLVTTKLTAAPQSLSTTGPGWSRPSSATPPAVAPSTATPATSADPVPSSSGPQHQPQSRPTPARGGNSRENAHLGGGSGKLAWGNTRLQQQRPDVTSQSDFPTAAEVAAAPRKIKPVLADRNIAQKEAELAAAANKQARAEEADTFRGVHLDPNAHHWDEMEEDDDNFLNGVIEFGDGRQYKIETSDTPESPPRNRSQSGPQPEDVPVSKEERFADDFDRSWPRSRASPSVSNRDLPTALSTHSSSSAAAPSPVSPSVSLAHGGMHSPQDTARGLLFNERSNKLEPYNRVAGATGSGQKRDSFSSGSPTDSRGQPGNNNVQLLQNRGRGFAPGGFNNDRQQQNPRVPVNPWTQKKDAEGPDARGRRSGTMGPPPVPPPGGRQRPPHLPSTSGETDETSARPARRPSTSRDSRIPPTADQPSRPRAPSQSPALSHASAVPQSPVVPPLSGAELDEARKDVMQTAAARAKARRQQEEEERTKAQERARQRAAEMAKAQETEQAAQAQEVIDIIETAVKSVEPKPEPELPKVVQSTVVAPDPPPPLRRPSISGHPPQPPLETRPGPPRRMSGSVPTLSPVDTGGSWRSKVSPVVAAAQTPVRQFQPRPPSIPSFVAPPSALDRVETLAETSAEDLEVVDFSDLAQFMGVSEEKPADSGTETGVVATPSRPPRPVASDFFDDRPSRPSENPSAIGRTSVANWRRPAGPESTVDESQDRPQSDRPSEALVAETLPTPSKDLSSSSVDHPPASPAVVVTPHAARAPRTQPYKEATMTTLDDVMSRIKGAIDGMQTIEREHRSVEAPVVPPTRSSLFFPSSSSTNRWTPSALRVRQFDPEPPEVIVTGCEVPRSPKPAWNTFVVRLPKISRPLEPVNRKQMLLFNRPSQVRWDVLSFDPPVEGMSRREFGVNEILFRKAGYKGKNKYKVLLPSTKGGPRVNIPLSPKVNGVAWTTWRKPLASASNLDLVESETGLSTMSRSPPPELPSHPSVASIPPSTSSKSDDVFGPSRSRSQPKMPVGSGVAFYRDSKVDAAEPDATPPVSFIVNSELEDFRQNSDKTTPSKLKPHIMVSSPGSSALTSSDSILSGSKSFTSLTSASKSPTSSPEIGMPSLISNTKTESKSSDDSTDRTPLTPPHPGSSWARSPLNKDLRGPDPEHLKAVWQQTSNKSGLHAVNSLEAIADDLPAIPFTLQDVKSEDGGTPPPTTTTAPSRMSLHDVTRAFQQVPSSSSSSSSLRPPISPPSTSAPVARPPSYSYSLPHPPNPQMMRPTYGPYSPMMNSPSPTLMYPMAPSPVPARMTVNGHAPIYSQPVWMPPQNPGMMRPMGSPYPQMMAYPPPGTPMYQPQPIQTPPGPPQANGARGRNGSVVPHQNAMYTGSPILMHAPPMPTYMTMPPARGDMRNDNGHPPMPPPHHPQPNGHTMHPPGYNPVPSNFVRPTW